MAKINYRVLLLPLLALMAGACEPSSLMHGPDSFSVNDDEIKPRWTTNNADEDE